MLRRSAPVAALLLLSSWNAHAAPKDAELCADASERGQLLRIKGKLRAARSEFLACVKDACPAVVRKDCAQFLVDLESTTPTVVLGARDPSGGDLTDVKVIVDGETIAERLEGKAIAMDPGVHKFRFEAAGRVTIEQTIVVREGERNRVVAVTMHPEVLSEKRGDKPSFPVAAWIVTGVSMAGFATFAVLGLSARSDFNALESRCGTRCPEDDVDRVRRKALYADIGLVVGLAGAGVATYLFVDHASKPRVQPALGAGWFGVIATF